MPNAVVLLPDRINEYLSSSVTVSVSGGDTSGNTDDLLRWNGRLFRFSSPDGSITYDFGKQVSFNSFAIVNHNLSENAQVTFEASNVSDFSNLVKQISISASKKNVFKRFDEISAQYVRLSINDPSSTYIFLDCFAVGISEELIENFSWGYRETPIYNQLVNKTLYGFEYVYHLSEQHLFELTFGAASNQLKDQIMDFLKRLVRSEHLFLFVPDPEVSEAYLVRIQSDISFVSESFDINEFNISLLERPFVEWI